jgi:hypothetical protein
VGGCCQHLINRTPISSAQAHAENPDAFAAVLLSAVVPALEGRRVTPNYLGDVTVGERVNFGAGSIIANYDGANKRRTVMGADVHVGSNCVLVAPITLSDAPSAQVPP